MIAVNLANAAKKRGPEGSRPTVRSASERRPTDGGSRRVREAEPKPETARGSGERRPTRGGAKPRRRPQKAPGGKGARILAPIAIIVVAIACLLVMSAQDSTSGSADRSTQTTESQSASEGSNSTGGESTAAGADAAAKDIPATYRVKAGDSFAAIAEEFGIEASTLAELNPDTDPRALQPGQKLKLK
jgi:hypothetical protein